MNVARSGRKGLLHILDREGYTLCGLALTPERMLHDNKTPEEWRALYLTDQACSRCHAEQRKIDKLGKGRNPMLNVNASR